jgi:hypothetical protein
VADSGNNRVLEYNAPLASGMAASHVFGQGGSFTTGLANNGGSPSANSLDSPDGVAVDKQGNVYVADTHNNRVLEYDTPLSTDTIADHVLGQTNFISNTANSTSDGARNLRGPTGVAVDAQGNLFVADNGNNRVLEYFAPLASGMAASRVFGQADFAHNQPNESGINALGLDGPRTAAVDAFGDLYVADAFNSRVLEYFPPLSSGMAAGRVFGQPDFQHNTANNPSLSANSLNVPLGVAVDGGNNLYVADGFNSRLLEYDWALVKVYLPLVMR